MVLYEGAKGEFVSQLRPDFVSRFRVGARTWFFVRLWWLMQHIMNAWNLVFEGKHSKGNATGSGNEPKEPGDQEQLKKDPVSTKEKVKGSSKCGYGVLNY